MRAEWIAYVLLVGGLLACAAACTEDILRRAAMPTRWVWVAELLLTTFFTGMSVRREAPTFNKVSVPELRVSALPAVAERPGLLEGILNARAWIDVAAARALSSAHLRLTARVQRSLLLAWFGTSATMLFILLTVHRRMARERRRWPLTLLFGAPVRITPSEGPAVVGISTPEIVVPRWFLERTAQEQQLVVIHEREHIAARDHLLPLGGLVIAALLPWHPAVWWAASRLRLAIELDCDARVLHRGVLARPYGRLLIDIAGQCAGHRVGALALADRPSHLERRLLAMKNTKPRFTLVRSATLGALAALSILVACEAKLPTSADVEKMDVASAEQALVQSKLLDEAGAKNVMYKVDGFVVTADEAHALSASDIATVNVSKGKWKTTKDRGTEYTSVNITTGAAGGKGALADVLLPPPPRQGLRLRPPMSVTADSMKINTEHGTLTNKTFAGLLYVDGVIKTNSTLATLSPETIESVEVIKGQAATKISSDPAAANGVIRITTKHAKQ